MYISTSILISSSMSHPPCSTILLLINITHVNTIELHRMFDDNWSRWLQNYFDDNFVCLLYSTLWYGNTRRWRKWWKLKMNANFILLLLWICYICWKFSIHILCLFQLNVNYTVMFNLLSIDFFLPFYFIINDTNSYCYSNTKNNWRYCLYWFL